PGTEHATWISADETWSAADSPHRIPYTLRLTARLTIEPCAVVQLAPEVIVEVGTSTEPGELVAVGTDGGELRPVRFEADGAPWAQIVVQPAGYAELRLAALSGGGGTVSGAPGALLLNGPAGGTNLGDVVVQAVVDRVVVADTVGVGVNLAGLAALDGASGPLWVQGGEVPVQIEPGVGHSLPEGLEITGNAADEILVDPVKTWQPDDTWSDHGVPYRVRGPLYVGGAEDGDTATLALGSGVTVKFEQEAGSGIVVGNSPERLGVLRVDGTPARPVTLTSGRPTPAAGDWMGVVYRYFPVGEASITSARVEYAGGPSGTVGFGCGPGGNDSALIIYGQGPEDVGPVGSFVTGTTFDHIAGTTVIVSGWTDDAGPNLVNDNTFGGDTPECKVSRPQRTGVGDVCDGGRDVCWQ
ncbi:MAG: hypothetical protein ABMA64_27675, partial [Myxococcota bacterium]